MGRNYTTCKWEQEDDWHNSALWHTECNEIHEIITDTPEENKMKFCCYCGRPLVQVLAKEV